MDSYRDPRSNIPLSVCTFRALWVPPFFNKAYLMNQKLCSDMFPYTQHKRGAMSLNFDFETALNDITGMSCVVFLQ